MSTVRVHLVASGKRAQPDGLPALLEVFVSMVAQAGILALLRLAVLQPENGFVRAKSCSGQLQMLPGFVGLTSWGQMGWHPPLTKCGHARYGALALVLL